MTAELQALARSCGCSTFRSIGDGLYEGACPSVSAKVALLDGLASRDARDPELRAFARDLVAGAPRATWPRILHAWVQSHVRYVTESVETFYSPTWTLASGGDCDDHVRLMLALARALDVPARAVPVEQCRAGVCAATHVSPELRAQLGAFDGWQWAETTIAARFGEAPLVALARLRASGEPLRRPDLGQLGELGGVGDVFLPFKGLRATSPEFRTGIVAIAESLRLDHDALAAVMVRESGFNPKARNPTSNATGLIQFMPSTAKKLGTTVEALFAMTREEQLPYVAKYYALVGGHDLTTARDHYMATFFPAKMRHPVDEVIASKGEAVYDQNAGLDSDHDGVLTVGDVGAAIDSTIAGAQARVSSEGLIAADAPAPGGAPASGLSTAARAALLAGAAGALGGVTWWLSRR